MRAFGASVGRKGENFMMNENKVTKRHLLPHERRAIMHIEFDERDWKLLREVFGDEDTAVAVAKIIREAPPEVQILAIQLINLIEEVA